jgi:hypothetical protein
VPTAAAKVPTVTMVVSPAAVVLTLVPTDLGVLREICRAVRCGARVHSPNGVVTS